MKVIKVYMHTKFHVYIAITTGNLKEKVNRSYYMTLTRKSQGQCYMCRSYFNGSHQGLYAH